MRTVKNIWGFRRISLQERERLGGLAKRLGSEVRSEFVDDVTHLCCGVIIRNVKLMRAIGAGKYVVQPDYIERSHSAGRWLEVNFRNFTLPFLC